MSSHKSETRRKVPTSDWALGPPTRQSGTDEMEWGGMKWNDGMEGTIRDGWNIPNMKRNGIFD